MRGHGDKTKVAHALILKHTGAGFGMPS